MRFFESGRFGVGVPQLRRKTEFYIFELMALAFGASLAQFFFVHELRLQTLAICVLGYAASFSAMIGIRCIHCREPLGKVNGKWSAFAGDSCSKRGRDRG